MKSLICRNANFFIKKGISRSNSFKLAWKDRKLINKTITIEYGTYDNFVTCKIYAIRWSDSLKCFIVSALTQYNQDIEFCACPKEFLNL